ncbi:hypothetical protein TELCIR_07595 [Teladorsagia circumcincta]|uniref:Uncharacterized protein n=1 Tax=Teladorsagia circumcincta TaxID=45464 RepID=A0A2G9UJX2_TELCI|nr:hypothetical protein TELCIR_07595 [Teladorsagia circumcincta]
MKVDWPKDRQWRKNECEIAQNTDNKSPIFGDPHGNPEAMNFYYNRPSSLSREIDLAVPAWDEGIFFRNMNRVLTIQNDQISTKQVRKLYIVLVFQTKVRLTMRNPQTWRDFHANYTSFTEFLTGETGKFLGVPVAGSYFYSVNVELQKDIKIFFNGISKDSKKYMNPSSKDFL